MRQPVLVWMAIVVGACTGGGGDRGDGVTVVDSADITVVTDPGAGIDRPLGVTLAPEPHLRIGTIQGGEETQLTQVRGLVRLSDGRLLLTGTTRERLRLFTRDGDFLNWIGRIGDGPGEYAQATEAGLLSGDTVWVHDGGRREFELFTPEGDAVRTFRPERSSEVQLPRRMWMLADGTVVDEGTTFAIGDPSSWQPGEFIEDVVLALFDRAGRDGREVTRARGLHYDLHPPGAGQGASFSALNMERWTPLPEFEAVPSTIVYADPGSFEVQVYSADARLRNILRVETPRRPVTPTLIDRYRTSLLADFEDDPGRQEIVRQSLDHYAYADSLPHFQRPMLEPDGTLWLTEYRVQGEPPSLYRIWRVDPAAGLEGYLEVSAELRVLTIRGDEVLGYVTDDYDVPYVVAYRLVER